MDYAAIRDGLKTRIETLSGIVAVYDTAPDRVTPPAVAVIPGEPVVTYHAAGAGGATALSVCEFDVILFAGRYQAAAAQDTLDGYMTTLPAALEGDQTLGGEAEVVIVREATNYGVVTVADSQFLGVRFVTEVLTT